MLTNYMLSKEPGKSYGALKIEMSDNIKKVKGGNLEHVCDVIQTCFEIFDESQEYPQNGFYLDEPGEPISFKDFIETLQIVNEIRNFEIFDKAKAIATVCYNFILSYNKEKRYEILKKHLEKTEKEVG